MMASRTRITRHSTRIFMKNCVEVTQIINEPYEQKMRAFLDAALAA